jgi:hypothetical protein
MEPLRLPTEEEVHTAAQQGEDAIVDLVFGVANNWSGVIRQLEERIQAFEDQRPRTAASRVVANRVTRDIP